MFQLECITAVWIPTLLANQGVYAILFSAAIAIISFWRVKKKEAKHKIFWMYTHLFALTFPLVSAVFSRGCHFIQMCASPTILLAIPASILGTILLGYFVVPMLYQRLFKTKEVNSGPLYEKINNLSQKENIGPPKIFIIDESKPIAFSTTSWKPKLFFSIGLLELLAPKELEAVILHELYHIQNNTPKLKLLGVSLKTISPFFAFSGITNVFIREEEKADNFAIQKQGDRKYLIRAKYRIAAIQSETK